MQKEPARQREDIGKATRQYRFQIKHNNHFHKCNVSHWFQFHLKNVRNKYISAVEAVMMCVTTMCLTGWNFVLKIIQNTYIDVTEAVMMFIVTAGDAQSSPRKGNAEDESTSDLESPGPVTSKRGRPRKYLTELDAVEARRRRAREYYHRNSERIKDQQKLYQHWHRDQLNLQRRARYSKKTEDLR